MQTFPQRWKKFLFTEQSKHSLNTNARYIDYLFTVEWIHCIHAGRKIYVHSEWPEGGHIVFCSVTITSTKILPLILMITKKTQEMSEVFTVELLNQRIMPGFCSGSSSVKLSNINLNSNGFFFFFLLFFKSHFQHFSIPSNFMCQCTSL